MKPFVEEVKKLFHKGKVDKWNFVYNISFTSVIILKDGMSSVLNIDIKKLGKSSILSARCHSKM